MLPVLIVVGVIVLLVLWFVGLYNGLISLRSQPSSSAVPASTKNGPSPTHGCCLIFSMAIG